MIVNWSDEVVERLKALWRDGKTGAAIAALLDNGASKNAVIGKLNRLGLKDADRKPPPAPTFVPPPDPEPVLVHVSVLPTGPVSLMDREEGQCRYPIDRDDAGLTLFCGARRNGKSPYCSACRAKMYVPAVNRRRQEAPPVAASPSMLRLVGG